MTANSGAPRRSRRHLAAALAVMAVLLGVAATVSAQAETPTPTASPTPQCPVLPEEGCRMPVRPHKAILLIRDRGIFTQIFWKWIKGAATAPSDFGNPIGMTAYDLCIYDGTPQPVFEFHLPPCTDCWKSTKTGFVRIPTSLYAKLLLRAGSDGRAKIVMHRPSADPLPLASLALPVRVQLTNSAGVCWEAVYSAPIDQSAQEFRAKAD